MPQITPEMCAKAEMLRTKQQTWREIGRILAFDAGRQTPFTDRGIARAVKRYKALLLKYGETNSD